MFVGGTPTPESSYCSFPRRLASSHQTRELVWSEAFGCRQKATSHQLHQAGALMELLSGRKIRLILGSSGVLVPLVYRSLATTPHQSLGPFGFRKVMGMSWGLPPVIIHFLGFSRIFHEINHPSSWDPPARWGSTRPAAWTAATATSSPTCCVWSRRCPSRSV